MTDQLETQTPEDRAEAAARDLADRGLAVTARAVREAAGVRMAVAAEAARAWREATASDDQEPIPEVPGDVRGRLAAIWADAYRAAVAVVSPERDRLAGEVRELCAEVEALTTAVGEVEGERDEHAARARDVERARDEADQARQQAVAERDEHRDKSVRAEHRADAAEERATRAEELTAAVKAERDRLAEQVRALIARIPEAKAEEDREGDDSSPTS